MSKERLYLDLDGVYNSKGEKVRKLTEQEQITVYWRAYNERGLKQKQCNCICHRTGSWITHIQPCCNETYKKHKKKQT